MKICIVGGTGNISTSIVKLLLKKGHDVYCFNRGITDPELAGDVRVIKGDRHDTEAFEKAMQKENFDAAIDMICFTAEDAASSIRAFRGVKHFIHTSTVVTYGTDPFWFPVSEDHPALAQDSYGKNKALADKVFLEAYYSEDFPVTIIKPSTTYGPKRVLRQIGIDRMWIDRIRKGKPLLVCGDGKAFHHFLHVDDAAKAYAGIVGKDHCIGQVYNMVNPNVTNWEVYHKTAMKILGKEVELVGVPLENLLKINRQKFEKCKDIFANNCFYDSRKIFRDVPEFKPDISLEEGLSQAFEYLDRNNMVPDSDSETWEDKIIEAQNKLSQGCFF